MYPRIISNHNPLFLFSYRTEVYVVCINVHFMDTPNSGQTPTDCRAKKANLITAIGSTCAPRTKLKLWIDCTCRVVPSAAR